MREAFEQGARDRAQAGAGAALWPAVDGERTYRRAADADPGATKGAVAKRRAARGGRGYQQRSQRTSAAGDLQRTRESGEHTPDRTVTMMKGGLGNLMKQAQAMQENLRKAQEELASIEVTGNAGGNLVSVVMTCRYDVRRVNIDAS